MKIKRAIKKFFNKIWNWRRRKTYKEIKSTLEKKLQEREEEKKVLKYKIYQYLKEQYGGNSEYFRRKLKNSRALNVELELHFKDELIKNKTSIKKLFN